MQRVRRRQLVSVDLYPEITLPIARPLDPVTRFCVECSAIFTLFSDGLKASPEKIHATASWIRIFPQLEFTEQFADEWADLGDDVRIERDEPRDNFGFSETLRVVVDHSILAAQPADRAELYLNWLTAVMTRAAEFRGWERQPLLNARQYCVDRELKARFESPHKQSPDRRHKAVLSLEIDHDGWRHLTLRISDRSSRIVALSAQRFPPFFLNSHDWRRIRNQIRWVSADVVQADDDHSPVTGMVFQGTHWITATVGTIAVSEEESPERPLRTEPSIRSTDWRREVAGLDDRY